MAAVFGMLFAAILPGRAAATESHPASTDNVTWVSKVYDFGAFDEDTKHKTATFRMVNTTADSVAIVSATATCGCTTPKYDNKPVAPGDTAVITVTYDPTGRPGRFEKSVYIRTSAANEKTKLVIKGSVIGNPESVKGRYPVEMGPLRMTNGAVLVGRVYKSNSKMTFMDIYNMSSDTLSPVIVGAPRYLTATVEPPVILPGEQAEINVFFRGYDCPDYGVVTDTLRISALAGTQQYSLPVIALVEEDFSRLNPDQLAAAPSAYFSTDRVQLGKIPDSGKAVKAEFTVKNLGEEPLEIRRVYTEDAGVTVKIDKTRVKRDKSARVTITVQPDLLPPGAVNARVTVITNDPAHPTTVIRVVGER